MARLVPIETCLCLPEALVLSSYLNGLGIVTVLGNYHHASTAWHTLFAQQGVQLSVLDVDLSHAREALVQAASPAHADGSQAASAWELAVAAAALVLTGLPMPLWLRRRRPASD